MIFVEYGIECLVRFYDWVYDDTKMQETQKDDSRGCGYLETRLVTDI